MIKVAISMNSHASPFKKSLGEASPYIISCMEGIDKYLNKAAKAELNIIDNSKAYIKIIEPSDHDLMCSCRKR